MPIVPSLAVCARNASISAYPNLWDGLFAAYLPVLGIQGNKIIDVVGRNDASYSNPGWNNSLPGNIASMSTGVTGYGIVNDSPSHRVSEISITVWMRARTGQSRYNAVVEKYYNDGMSAPYVNWGFEWNTTSIQFDLSPGGSLHSLPLVTVGEDWSVVTGTYSMVLGATVYVNGILKQFDPSITGVLSGYSSTLNTLCIGGGGYGNTVTNVDFGAVLLHNRPLSASEVMVLSNDPLAPFRIRPKIQFKNPRILLDPIWAAIGLPAIKDNAAFFS